MDANTKLDAIKAKNFTYVSVSYLVDPEGWDLTAGYSATLKFDRFVVLTPSRPIARQAAEQIIQKRIGQPIVKRLNHGVPNSGATCSLYPRNYVGWAKAMVQNDPDSVYAVEAQMTVSFNN